MAERSDSSPTPQTLRSAQLAGLWLSESNNASSEWCFGAHVNGRAYATRGATGKGLGGFALRCHQRGERIHAEAPLLQWVVGPGMPLKQVALEEAVSSMDDRARGIYYGLMQAQMYGKEKNACASTKACQPRTSACAHPAVS